MGDDRRHLILPASAWDGRTGPDRWVAGSRSVARHAGYRTAVRSPSDAAPAPA